MLTNIFDMSYDLVSRMRLPLPSLVIFWREEEVITESSRLLPSDLYNPLLSQSSSIDGEVIGGCPTSPSPLPYMRYTESKNPTSVCRLRWPHDSVENGRESSHKDLKVFKTLGQQVVTEILFNLVRLNVNLFYMNCFNYLRVLRIKGLVTRCKMIIDTNQK